MFSSIYVNLSAGTADTHYIAMPYKARIEKIYFTSDGTLAAHATNYFTLSVKDHSGDVVGTFNTSTGSGISLTAGTPVAVTVDGQYADIAAGEAIQI